MAAGPIYRRGRTKIDFLRRVIINFSDDKVRSVTTLALFDVHGLGKRLPHAVLPLQVVLLHALVVVALSAHANADCVHLFEVTVDVAGDEVVVLVCLVAETEDDIFEAGELVLAVREFKGLVGEVLAELNSVVRGLSLAVGSHDEEDAAVVRKLVEVLEVVLFRVADQGRKTELGLGLLCETNGVLFRSTCLRAVEDDDALFLYDVAWVSV